VNHSNDLLNFETNLNFRETAFLYVFEARSWLLGFHKNPHCARIPDDAVLRRYVDSLSWIRMADGIDLHNFWDRLLEEHGFESDRMKVQRAWKRLVRRAQTLATTRGLPVPCPNRSPGGRFLNK
jgi:hypothetical protein